MQQKERGEARIQSKLLTKSLELIGRGGQIKSTHTTHILHAIDFRASGLGFMEISRKCIAVILRNNNAITSDTITTGIDGYDTFIGEFGSTIHSNASEVSTIQIAIVLALK
jgi:hypothetical protein